MHRNWPRERHLSSFWQWKLQYSIINSSWPEIQKTKLSYVTFQIHTKGTISFSWCNNSVIPSGNRAIWEGKKNKNKIKFMPWRLWHSKICKIKKFTGTQYAESNHQEMKKKKHNETICYLRNFSTSKYLIPVTSALITYKMPQIFFKFFIRSLN